MKKAKLVAAFLSLAIVISVFLSGCAGAGSPVQDAGADTAAPEAVTESVIETNDPVTEESSAPETEIPQEQQEAGASRPETQESSSAQEESKPQKTSSEQSAPEKTSSAPAPSSSSSSSSSSQAQSSKSSSSDPHAWGEDEDADDATFADPYSNYKGNKITVSVSIDSSTMGSIVTGSTTVSIPEGSLAYTALKTAFDKMNVSYSMSKNYLSYLGGLAEKDGGPMSGWLYYVNGVAPSVGIGNYTVKDGDSIRLYYTLDGSY